MPRMKSLRQYWSFLLWILNWVEFFFKKWLIITYLSFLNYIHFSIGSPAKAGLCFAAFSSLFAISC